MATSQAPVSDALVPMLQNKGALIAEYRKRNSAYSFLTVHPADEEAHAALGWEVHRRGKKQLRLRRPKSHDRALEDRAWCLFYRMG